MKMHKNLKKQILNICKNISEYNILKQYINLDMYDDAYEIIADCILYERKDFNDLDIADDLLIILTDLNVLELKDLVFDCREEFYLNKCLEIIDFYLASNIVDDITKTYFKNLQILNYYTELEELDYELMMFKLYKTIENDYEEIKRTLEIKLPEDIKENYYYNYMFISFILLFVEKDSLYELLSKVLLTYMVVSNEQFSLDLKK